MTLQMACRVILALVLILSAIGCFGLQLTVWRGMPPRRRDWR